MFPQRFSLPPGQCAVLQLWWRVERQLLFSFISKKKLQENFGLRGWYWQGWIYPMCSLKATCKGRKIWGRQIVTSSYRLLVAMQHNFQFKLSIHFFALSPHSRPKLKSRDCPSPPSKFLWPSFVRCLAPLAASRCVQLIGQAAKGTETANSALTVVRRRAFEAHVWTLVHSPP